jgi:hypothetical protein
MTQQRQTFIDDPEYLKRWFLEKGHPFLVFRTADLMELLASDQRMFLRTVQTVVPAELRTGPIPERDDDLRGYLQRSVGFRGYVRVPIDRLIGKLEFDDLRRFQGFCTVYRSVRENKFEPSRVEDCDCIIKNGPPPKKDCEKCEGTGRLTVLLEVSDVETALAEGRDWAEIEGI